MEVLSDLYRTLDDKTAEALAVAVSSHRKSRRGAETGVPADESASSKVARLKARPKALVGDPQRLVHVDWSKERKP